MPLRLLSLSHPSVTIISCLIYTKELGFCKLSKTHETLEIYPRGVAMHLAVAARLHFPNLAILNKVTPAQDQICPRLILSALLSVSHPWQDMLCCQISLYCHSLLLTGPIFFVPHFRNPWPVLIACFLISLDSLKSTGLEVQYSLQQVKSSQIIE